jgi:diamine N-acetyltransferase
MPAADDQVTYRRATPGDAPALAEFARRTFLETFAAQNRPEDVEAYIARVYGDAQQAAEIANPRITTLVGEAEGRMAAYVQLRLGSPAACVDGPAPIEIMRFYVDRPWHGSGVARRMMDTALATARELGARTAWLAVWEHNPRAMAFYSKRGFRAVGEQGFQLGNDLQNDFVMVLPLDADAAD